MRPLNVPESQNCHGDPTGDEEADIWLARSYSVGNSHKLQAYSVGLKITGYTAGDLNYYLDPHEDSTRTPLQSPTLSVTPNPGFMLIGGGAELLGDSASGPSGYLTDQRPSADHASWVSTAVFNSGTSGIIKGFGIGIKDVPLSGGYLVTRWRTATSNSGTGYRSVSGSTPFPWAPGPIGVSGLTNGASSRYLADLVPLGNNETAGFSVTTKDEGSTGVSGSTIGYQVNLLSYSTIAPYNYNTIRFSNFGNPGFSRPAGAAPVNLQQATGATTNAMHWYLEDRGGGKYRVRAGQPNTGTECAARDPNSVGAVRVMACGTSNDFLFVVDYGAIDANFRLRNVANSKCIDNLSSTSTSDLAFRTCPASNVSSASTQLYLGQSSWPP